MTVSLRATTAAVLAVAAIACLTVVVAAGLTRRSRSAPVECP